MSPICLLLYKSSFCCPTPHNHIEQKAQEVSGCERKPCTTQGRQECESRWEGSNCLERLLPCFLISKVWSFCRDPQEGKDCDQSQSSKQRFVYNLSIISIWLLSLSGAGPHASKTGKTTGKNPRKKTSNPMDKDEELAQLRGTYHAPPIFYNSHSIQMQPELSSTRRKYRATEQLLQWTMPWKPRYPTLRLPVNSIFRRRRISEVMQAYSKQFGWVLLLH